jgi:hypothetical protein
MPSTGALGGGREMGLARTRKLLAALLGIVTTGGTLAGEATRQSKGRDEVCLGAVLVFAWAVLDPVPLVGGASAPYSEFDRAPYEYRAAKTQLLVNIIRTNPDVVLVLFNDPAITGVTPYRKHDDHLHVRLRP